MRPASAGWRWRRPIASAPVAAYPSRWENDVVLADGGTVRIRPIRPDDGDRLVAMHSRLSPQSVYFRFFQPRPRLQEREVRHFTDVDYERRMALVALLGDEMVAMAGYEGREGSDDAEVAFVVDDDHQRRGIATVLLEHLGAVARENGIVSFNAVVLPENRKMISVFTGAGFETRRAFAGGVIEVTMSIEATEAATASVEAREHRAEARSVSRLLSPRSVAVVGASRRPGRLGQLVFQNLRQHGFEGPVHPVNAEGGVVDGVPAVRRVTDIEGEVDLAVIVVPAPAVPAVVADCGAKGVAGLVVISAGFAEVGPAGAEAQRALVGSARAHGMRLVGPNSLGLLNTDPAVRLHATFAPVAPLTGRLGFSSQSGTLGVAILRHATTRGLGFSTFVGIGNRADLSTNDLLQYWEDDDRTDMALLYVEAFGNPRKFTRLARRVSRTKPILTVKQLPPPRGNEAGSALDALFLQSGVVRVDTLQQLFDVAQVLVEQPLPAGRRVAVVGTAGTTGLAADACVGAGLELVPLAASTMATLTRRLGPAVGRNPVGLSFEAGPDDWELVLDAVLADDGVDAVLTLLLSPVADDAPDLARAFARAAGRTGKPVLATVLGGDDGTVVPDGVTVFAFPEAAATALGRVAAYADWRRRPAGVVPALDGVDPGAARRIVAGALAAGPAKLGTFDTLDLLTAYGIEAAPVHEVRSATEAGAAAARFGGPVTIKAQRLPRLGKVEEGGLSLDLQTPGDAVLAYERMFRALGDAMVPAIVQPMVPSGVDVLVAVHQDATFGPVLSLGPGGATADFAPRVVRVLPLTDLDVSDLVRAPPLAGLLFDPDGEPVVDVTALEGLLLRVGRLTEDLPEVVSLRLNPVIVAPAGATVVGAEASVALASDRPAPVRRVG